MCLERTPQSLIVCSSWLLLLFFFILTVLLNFCLVGINRFDSALISMSNGMGHTLEGLVLSDSMHFFVRALKSNNVVRNVKTVGAWMYNSDGVVLGANGRVEDSFFHVNDDAIKLYHSGLQVHRCVVWQAQNGAVFQTGWNNNRRVLRNALVTDVDIIHIDWCTFKAGRQCNLSENKAVFNHRQQNMKSIDINDVEFRNIRVEGSSPRIIYWKPEVRATGTATNVRFVNWTVEAEPTTIRYYPHDNKITPTQRISLSNWIFNNFRVRGQCMHNARRFNLTIDERTTRNIQFSCT